MWCVCITLWHKGVRLPSYCRIAVNLDSTNTEMTFRADFSQTNDARGQYGGFAKYSRSYHRYMYNIFLYYMYILAIELSTLVVYKRKNMLRDCPVGTGRRSNKQNTDLEEPCSRTLDEHLSQPRRESLHSS